LEPHQQNDAQNHMIAPKGYADHFRSPYVPQDLRPFPGNWQTELPDYYGSIEAIDQSVGRVLKTLEQQGMLDNTIFIFTSDHGCHFMTRNEEYKRSPHNASIRIPLVVQGPGFNAGQRVEQVVGNINVMPTLLEAAGVPVPASVKGKSVLPMLTDAKAREQWHNAELIQISESMTARAIRTPEWCYCAVDREPKAIQRPGATVYEEYQMYDEGADPYELTNLAGRKEYRVKANELAAQLKRKIVEAGEPEPRIKPATLYP
jgi:arylsulfatase A-like enzyme